MMEAVDGHNMSKTDQTVLEKEDSGVFQVEGNHAPTKQELTAVRRRIDMHLVPIMMVTYAIQYYDKSVLNQAALFGILTDLDLKKVSEVGGKQVVDTTRFSYVAMIFYCGYLLGVYPATLLAQKYRAGKVCAGLVFVWSVVEILTAACSTYEGILAQRFFLGMCEAGIAPSFVIACSQWYTPAESSFRIALWWSSNGVTAMVGPLVSYGFGSLNGPIPGWKSIYLWAGFLTFAWSFVIFWVMPDDPQRAKFLSDRERFVALERVKDNNAGLVNHKIKASHIKDALFDPATWLLTTLMFTAVTANSIVGVFSSVIIKGLGFNNLQALALQVPTGFFGVCCGVLPAIIILRTNRWRTVILSTLMTLSVIGTAILYRVPSTNVGAVLVGYYFNNFFVGCPNIVLALSAANIGGHTKKSTVNGCVFIAYCAGSIMSPLIMKAQDHYHSGFLGILICQCYVVVAAQALHMLYRRRNQTRDSAYGEQVPADGFSDETDGKNPNFRYST